MWGPGVSMSGSERSANKKMALTTLVELLGDRRLSSVAFPPEHPRLKDVVPTTWRELLDDGLIDDSWRTHDGTAYRLTPAGWLRGLAVSGAVQSASTRSRCQKLATALKRVVKGRSSPYDKRTSLDGTAAEIGEPEGWIYNAVKSRLLGAVFPNDRWDAHLDHKVSNLVHVAPTFGLDHLDE